MSRRQPFRLGELEVPPGTRANVDLPVARTYTHGDITLPVAVQHGRRPGPVMFLSAAIHGDELNGIEIIRRVLAQKALARVKGTLLAVPIVNVHGVMNHSRYLPDRRDLNRCFPGSSRGSLASRLANVFVTEVVERSDLGVDLHTGALHRANYPQIRGVLADPETERLAREFGAPVILDAQVRKGTLREAASQRGMPMLVFEGGEALRFDEMSIRAGVRGVLAVMRAAGMLPPRKRRRGVEPYLANSSSWVRAPESGLLRSSVRLGDRVVEGQRLGVIAGPLGGGQTEVQARATGIVIGETRLPLVNEGDALFHVATFERSARVEASLEAYREVLGLREDDPEGGVPD